MDRVKCTQDHVNRMFHIYKIYISCDERLLKSFRNSSLVPLVMVLRNGFLQSLNWEHQIIFSITSFYAHSIHKSDRLNTQDRDALKTVETSVVLGVVWLNNKNSDVELLCVAMIIKLHFKLYYNETELINIKKELLKFLKSSKSVQWDIRNLKEGSNTENKLVII